MKQRRWRNEKRSCCVCGGANGRAEFSAWESYVIRINRSDRLVPWPKLQFKFDFLYARSRFCLRFQKGIRNMAAHRKLRNINQENATVVCSWKKCFNNYIGEAFGLSWKKSPKAFNYCAISVWIHAFIHSFNAAFVAMEISLWKSHKAFHNAIGLEAWWKTKHVIANCTVFWAKLHRITSIVFQLNIFFWRVLL